MNTGKIFNYTLALVMLLSQAHCNLDEVPSETLPPTNRIQVGKRRRNYIRSSFYDLLPNTDVGVFQDDDNSDLVARNGVDNYRAPGALSPITSTGWSLSNWTDLRNINCAS